MSHDVRLPGPKAGDELAAKIKQAHGILDASETDGLLEHLNRIFDLGDLLRQAKIREGHGNRRRAAETQRFVRTPLCGTVIFVGRNISDLVRSRSEVQFANELYRESGEPPRQR